MVFFRFIFLLIAYVGAFGAAGLAQSASVGNYYAPFSSASPWNVRPVAPVLGSFEIPKSDYFPTVTQGKWSSGVFLAKATDAPGQHHDPALAFRGEAGRG